MQKIWQGVFWKIISCGCFAATNILVRYLSGGSALHLSKPLPIYSIMFFQNIIGMSVISLWLWQKPHQGSLRTKKPGLHALRVTIAAFGIAMWYISLRYIPVTQVVALSFIAPMLTSIGAVILLKEHFNIRRGLAILLSIAGGFLIARPDKALSNASVFNWYMLLPLLATLIFSMEKLLTRELLKQNESPQALTWYLLTFIAPLCLVPVLYYGWVTPNKDHIYWLLLLGILAALANYAFNRAYELAEVTVLLPFGIAKLLISAALSYLVFLEIPNSIDIWFGVLIIAVTTVIVKPTKNLVIKYAQT